MLAFLGDLIPILVVVVVWVGLFAIGTRLIVDNRTVRDVARALAGSTAALLILVVVTRQVLSANE